MEDLNSYHPDINFTHESTNKSINFLYVTVNLQGFRLYTELYINPTDRNKYLDYSSSYPYKLRNELVTAKY